MADRRALGQTGLDVFPLCLGGNVFGWSADEEASFAVLDAYVEAGGNFVDTANVYSRGESEALVGRWRAARGDARDLVVATKVGMLDDEGLSRRTIRRAAEESLGRLQTDRIDLYYAHRDDPSTPLEETVRAFDELVSDGLVRAVGASNYSADRLAEALRIADRHGLARFEVLQPHYSLVERAEYEGALEALCRAEGLGVAPYFSLARGFLTGKYRPGQPLPESPRAAGVVRDYLNERGAAVLGALDEVAEAHSATPAQAALAWLMARPGVVAPIASATSPQQVRELAASAGLRLDEREAARLEGAAGQPLRLRA